MSLHGERGGWATRMHERPEYEIFGFGTRIIKRLLRLDLCLRLLDQAMYVADQEVCVMT
jgi:hypothetical protein